MSDQKAFISDTSAQKIFDTFIRSDYFLDQGKFPIMSSFAQEEINMWMETLNEYNFLKKEIIELGCGLGRALHPLQTNNINCFGIDCNQLMIKHCINKGLSAEVHNIYEPIKNHIKNRFQTAVISVNTLFNAQKNQRRLWIRFAYDCLQTDGLLIFSVYGNNRNIKQHTKQRINFYKSCIEPDETAKTIKHFESGTRRGIHMIDNQSNKENWCSEWHNKTDIIAEIRSWSDLFNIKKFELLPCQIAYCVVLQKKT